MEELKRIVIAIYDVFGVLMGHDLHSPQTETFKKYPTLYQP